MSRVIRFLDPRIPKPFNTVYDLYRLMLVRMTLAAALCVGCVGLLVWWNPATWFPENDSPVIRTPRTTGARPM